MNEHRAQPPGADDSSSRRGDTFALSVVSHRQRDLVERVLADLARLRPRGLARVILTHNVPEPPLAFADPLPFALDIVENAAPLGFGANHNAAFARCTDAWFVVCNPDVRLGDDPFPALLSAAAPGVGLVTPTVLEADGHPADFARALLGPAQLLSRLVAGGRRGPDPDPAWFAGMFLMVRREAFAAIGGFDERFHMYCEDADLCARLRLGGWSLEWARGATVVHDARRASRRSARHLAWHVASLARMWSGRTWWRYRALLAAQRRAGAATAAAAR